MTDNVDPVLMGIISRSMKQLYIDHARKKGATEDWIKSLENLDWQSVCYAIGVCYGDPETPKKDKAQ